MRLVCASLICAAWLVASAHAAPNDLRPDPDPSAAAVLTKTRTTEHFSFFFADDENSLEGVFAALEKNYPPIVAAFQMDLPDRTRVEIYPDIAHYQRRVFGRPIGDWAIGNFSPDDGVLRMASPNDCGKVHTHQGAVRVAVHEFVHRVIFEHRGRTREGLPNWLDEGTAEYYSSDFSPRDEMAVREAVGAGRIPSLDDLERDFMNQNGYAFSFTIVDFIVRTYGKDKLMALIKGPVKDPDSYQRIFAMSKKDLDAAWQRSLKRQYQSFDSKKMRTRLESMKASLSR